jgi:phosphate transport system permease protein
MAFSTRKNSRQFEVPFNIKMNVPQVIITSCAIITLIIIVFFIGFIFVTAFPTFTSQGLYIFYGQTWDYETQTYGALNYIVGTLALTAITMTIAVPISLFTAIYLAEFAPDAFRSVARPMIELLVGIPSVVYGIFGLFILEPIFGDYINPAIDSTLGSIPIFHNPTAGNGNGILLASTVLAIMILPTIIALSEESIRSVPREYREASISVGATRWETLTRVMLPVAMPGIMAGIILGMMRAAGETMAVIMLMGNNPHIPTSILDNGYAMTSKILGDSEAHIVADAERSAMFAMAAILFLLEMGLAAAVRAIVGRRPQ